MPPTKRRTKNRSVRDVAAVPAEPKDQPTYCPLFPTVRTASVGKVFIKRFFYNEMTKSKEEEVITDHPLIRPEMDEGDLRRVSGGGNYFVSIHKNDGSGQMISQRRLNIAGPERDPEDFGDDDDFDDDDDPRVIRNSDGSQTIIPPGLKGPALAAYLSQEERVKAAEREKQSGGGILGQVLAATMQQTTTMMTAMMSGGGQNSAAMMALQGQLNAANTEKAALIAQHGAALNALREEHSATMSTLRAELAKALDEGRRLTGLMELRTEEARASARKSAHEDMSKLRQEIHRLEQSLLGSERNALRIQASARATSETVELAKLFAPQVEKALSKLGGASGLPPELQATVDAINKEILPAVRKLNAHPMLQPMNDSAEPLVESEPEPVPATAPAENGASNDVAAGPLVSVPDMPG